MQKVYIYGIGFVGYPLLLTLANLKNNNYEVIGVEKNNQIVKKIQKKIQSGNCLIETSDKKLSKLAKTFRSKKIKILADNKNLSLKGIVIITINFDSFKNIKKLKQIFKRICNNLCDGTTIIIESTLIPGTTERILLPILKKSIINNKLDKNKIFFGFSYERVMPGEKYIESITNNFRNISGINLVSIKKIKSFYKTFINWKLKPFHIFKKITECEFAKVVENSYRALNIAYIDELNYFSLKANLNLNSVLSSIRVRETHKNIMNPGIGVGGYCLTKDPGFIVQSSKKIFQFKNNFPLINNLLKINNNMPEFSKKFILGKIKNPKKKKLLIVGYSYKNDVDDIRYSPTIDLYKRIKKNFLSTEMIDPVIDKKKYKLVIKRSLKKYQIILLCVNHKSFKYKKLIENLNKNSTLFDLCFYFSEAKFNSILKEKKIKLYQIGKYD